MLDVKRCIILFISFDFASGLDTPFFWVTGLHESLILSVESNEIFGEGWSDVYFQTFVVFRPVNAGSHVLFLLLGLNTLE